MQEIALASPFKELWADKNPFTEAFRLDGESFRQVKSRHTFRFETGGKGYFAKLHHGCGWHEIFKDLFQFKRPILGADNEYRALLHLKKQNIDTMTPCAYGMRGSNPAHLQSFLITRELTGVVSLEDLCLNWQENPPVFSVKAALIRKLGTMTGRMHRSGLNHRDCYICHFLLKKIRWRHPTRRSTSSTSIALKSAQKCRIGIWSRMLRGSFFPPWTPESRPATSCGSSAPTQTALCGRNLRKTDDSMKM